MKTDLLLKYIQYSEIAKSGSFKIKHGNVVVFSDSEANHIITLSESELLSSDIFIGCLSKVSGKSEIEFKMMHKNISDIEDFILNLK